jgi:ABC-2 type transport system ATP-binding protein
VIAIAVRDVTKRYGELAAVDGVSFDVQAGEVFGILGPNGAGKTTTLEIIEGLRNADGGEVTVLGERPWPRNAALLPRIGVQIQATAFLDKLTAREQLGVWASLYGTAAARVDAMLDLVGLSDKSTTRVEALSGGQKQRLSIACALVHEPEIVFLDEPTAALDPQARRNLWDLIREIRSRGATVVITTHYMDEADALCDRVAIMDHGRILALDAPVALRRDLDAPVRIALPIGALSVGEAQAIDGAGGVREDGASIVIETRTPERVLSALASRGALDGLQVSGANLEDVFLTLTGREYRP